MIYNSMGVLINNEEIWMKRLEEVKIYMDVNDKKPSVYNKIKNIKQLGYWIFHQIHNYKNFKKCMKNKKIYNKWKEFIDDIKYKKYFISIEEKWFKNLEEIKKYIIENDKIPSRQDKNNNIKQLGVWITSQKNNYQYIKKIMKNQEIYEKWKEFINDEKYKYYFISIEEKWLINFEKIKKYIDENDKRPLYTDKNNDIKQLGKFLSNQITNFKKKNGIMKNEKIYNIWKKFINNEKYKKYFTSFEEIWLIKFDEIKKYINENDKIPTSHNKNNDIKQLGIWIGNQITNFKKKYGIMKNEEIYNKLKEFINDDKYKKYFISNDEIWIKQLEEIKKYINENNKRPSQSNKNNDIKKLGNWIQSQQQKYKNKKQSMKNEEIYNKWKEFINDEKYKVYFQI